MERSEVKMAWPNGAEAWFVCRAKGRVLDITIPLKADVRASEKELAEQGRMRAARRFKKLAGLHPCTKVECEFQGVELPA